MEKAINTRNKLRNDLERQIRYDLPGMTTTTTAATAAAINCLSKSLLTNMLYSFLLLVLLHFAPVFCFECREAKDRANKEHADRQAAGSSQLTQVDEWKVDQVSKI